LFKVVLLVDSGDKVDFLTVGFVTFNCFVDPLWLFGGLCNISESCKPFDLVPVKLDLLTLDLSMLNNISYKCLISIKIIILIIIKIIILIIINKIK